MYCMVKTLHIILLYSIRVQSLVSIAQAVFLLECGQTDSQTDKETDATERYTHAGGYTAGVGNDNNDQLRFCECKFNKTKHAEQQ